MTVLIGLVGVVLGALAGAIATYLTTRSTMRLELEHVYDRGLRDKRLERYQHLFHVSECLPRYWMPDEKPTRQDLRRFRQGFHEWYFGEEAGGMFLSPAAKDAYMRMMNALAEAILENGNSNIKTDTALSASESQTLRTLASELRHQLAEDVGAANPSRLQWTRLGPTIQPPKVSG